MGFSNENWMQFRPQGKAMSRAKILITGITSIVIQFGLAIAEDGARSLRIERSSARVGDGGNSAVAELWLRNEHQRQERRDLPP